MRTLGLILVVLGYLWLVQDSRIVGRGKYSAILSSDTLARDTTQAIPLTSAYDAVNRAVDIALAEVPNPLWPGTTMLAGSLLVWVGRRREVRKGSS